MLNNLANYYYKYENCVIIEEEINRKEEGNMPLVTTKEILLDAQKNKYAIGAFNVENMEMVMAVVAAAEELKALLINVIKMADTQA